MVTIFRLGTFAGSRYATVGVDSSVSKSPAAFGSFVRDEFARWEKAVRQANVQLQ